jgi:hypothetical protein
MRPGISVIEYIDRCILRLFRCHRLNIDQPRWKFAFLNGIEEILDMIIRFGSGKAKGSFRIQRFYASIGLDVPFNIHVFSILIELDRNPQVGKCETCSSVQCVSVNTKPVNMPERGRNPALSKQVHQGMNALRVVYMVVPEHSVVGNIGLRMPLMAPIHWRELDRITEKEDWQIIEDEIMDSLIREEFDRPSSNISDRVTGTFFSPYGWDPGQQSSLFADSSQEISISEIWNVIQNFKLSKSSSSFSVNTPVNLSIKRLVKDDEGMPFWNSLARKMSQDFHKLDIIQSDQASIGISIANLFSRARILTRLASIALMYISLWTPRKLTVGQGRCRIVRLLLGRHLDFHQFSIQSAMTSL